MSAKGVLRILEGGLLAFYCPGCRMHHAFDSRWTFNGDYEKPTFSPSLLVGPWWRMPHDWDRDIAPKNENGDLLLGPDGIHILGGFEARCHSFVRNGMIEFLSDCTHEFAGKTVPIILDEE